MGGGASGSKPNGPRDTARRAGVAAYLVAMLELRVESVRGDRVESVHRVSAVIVDARGGLLASIGDADLVTFWRSAAKPFQAIPLVADGAADRFGFGPDALALACASHSSEPAHIALAAAMLAQAGRVEADLACGPHVPLCAEIAAQVAREGRTLTPLWSNCSGKHAGMLALATHHGWPTRGYEHASHRVQERILIEVSRWTGTPQDAVGRAVDGCTAVCFALPLSAMALGYARLAASTEEHAVRVRNAMMTHPWHVGGTTRPCTDLMTAAPGTVFAKIGAEGVYCAGIPGAEIGIALKVEDGDMRCAPIALLAVLQQLAERVSSRLSAALASANVARHAEVAIRNTRDEPTGYLRARGALCFATTGAGSVRT
jgi:L-asparaginase II